MRAACRSSRSIICSATSPRCGSRPSRSSRRSRACWPPAVTRSCSTWPTTRRRYVSAARATTPQERRSTRARGCSASATPGGAALEALARDGRPRALPVPARAARPERARSLVLGPQDGAPLHASASSATASPSARADLAASYQAAIVRQLVERAEAALDATGRATLALVGGVAANGVAARRARRRMRRARRAPMSAAARAVRRQRGHDRRRGAGRREPGAAATTSRSTPTRGARSPGRLACDCRERASARWCTLIGS